MNDINYETITAETIKELTIIKDTHKIISEQVIS